MNFMLMFFKSLHPKVVASSAGVAVVASAVGVAEALGVKLSPTLLSLAPIAAFVISFGAGYMKKGPEYLGAAGKIAAAAGLTGSAAAEAVTKASEQ